MRMITGASTRRRFLLPRQYAGFTFLGLMIILTIMGIGLLSVGEVWHATQQREKEKALLFVGGQFRDAIHEYYLHAPAANKLQPYPDNLEDLLKDPRYPSTQRYLRKIYRDPISGSTEWGLLKNGPGIYGVYSLSEDEPIKKSGFKLAEVGLEGKTKYSEWQFSFVPVAPTGTVNKSADKP